MTETKYNVYHLFTDTNGNGHKGNLVATFIVLEHALLFVESYYYKYFKEEKLGLVIERIEEVE